MMRLGYFAMPLHPPGSDPAQTMDEMIFAIFQRRIPASHRRQPCQ